MEQPKSYKRKKSFLKRQKQHGKKGRYGRGVELDEDSYNYFIRIMEVVNSLKHKKDNREDLEILANNAVEEIAGREVDTCSNQLASRVIETLLPYINVEKLIAFGDSLGCELRLVYTDQFCSHVLQQLIIILTEHVCNKTDEIEHRTKLIDVLTKIAMFALNNVEDFMFDQYANHCLRTLFAAVNGRPTKEDSGSCERLENVPDWLDNLAAEFTDKLVLWPQFNDLTTQTLPSACLQSLLVAVRHSPKLVKKIVKRILDSCKSNESINFDDENNKPFLCLIETAISVVSPKYFNKILEKYFKWNLKELSLSKCGNFIVQKLLLHCVVIDTFNEMFDDLSSHFDALLNCGHSGVLFAMAKSCRRLKTRQGDFSKLLTHSLHGEETEERRNLISPLIYCLTRFEKYNENTKVSLHGSLILQEMLFFSKPIRLVSSLLAMEVKTLVSLLSDPRGCHITDAFCSSSFVGEKNREKLFRKLLGNYSTLATSKHGSRSFDAIWLPLSNKQKISVMEELKLTQSSVVSTPCGLIIASKVRLDLFRKDRETWVKHFTSQISNVEKNTTKIVRK